MSKLKGVRPEPLPDFARRLRAIFTVAAILTVAAPALPDAAVNPKREGWRHSRSVALPPIKEATQVYLPLDEHALGMASSLSEYRILRSDGAETPYRMIEERGQTETYSLTTTTVFTSAPAARPQELVLDAKAHPSSALVLRIVLSGAKQGVVARVEGCSDRMAWKPLGEAKSVPAPSTTVDDIAVRLRPGADRYFRIRLFSQGKSIPRMAGWQLNVETPVRRVLVPVPARVTIKRADQNRKTVIQLDPQHIVRDLDEVQIDIAEPAFDRAVTVETSANGKSWETSYGASNNGSASIHRLAPGDPVKLAMSADRTRMLRLSIGNGNDRPLTIRGVTLYRFRRGLIFPADKDQQYMLWYGRHEDVSAATPDYDIQRMPLITPPGNLPVASLGAAAEVPPPWSEQHPTLLWIALTGVVGLLVVAILRSMKGIRRRAGPGGSDSRVHT